MADPRVRPPADLEAVERELWLEMVNGKPADWFVPAQIPLMRQYVKHAVTARLLQQQIAAFDPAWLENDEGMRRYDRLLAMHEREGRAISSLATKMRLTQQSQYAPRVAATAAAIGTSRGGRKPWQTQEYDADA